MKNNKNFNLTRSLLDAVKKVITADMAINKNGEIGLVATTPSKERKQEVEQNKLDPVGREDSDVDNDGEVDKSDAYLAARRKVVAAAIKAGKATTPESTTEEEEDEDKKDEDEPDTKIKEQSAILRPADVRRAAQRTLGIFYGHPTGPTRMQLQQYFNKLSGTLNDKITKTEKAFNLKDLKVTDKGPEGYSVVNFAIAEDEDEIQLSNKKEKILLHPKLQEDHYVDPLDRAARKDTVLVTLKHPKTPEEIKAKKSGGGVHRIPKKDFDSNKHELAENINVGLTRRKIIAAVVRMGEGKLVEGYEKEVLLVLKDEGIYGHFKDGVLYVDKADVEAATSAIKSEVDQRVRALDIQGVTKILVAPKIIGETSEHDSPGWQRYEKEVLLVLKDEGIVGHFKDGVLYVDKADVEAAASAIKSETNILVTPKIIGETSDEESSDFSAMMKRDARRAIHALYEKEVLLVLRDEGIDGHFKDGVLYVDKADVEAAASAIDADRRFEPDKDGSWAIRHLRGVASIKIIGETSDEESKEDKEDKKKDPASAFAYARGASADPAAGVRRSVNEWTISDVELAMKKKYGKVDREAIEKLKDIIASRSTSFHTGNVDRNALVKVGHGQLHVGASPMIAVAPGEINKLKLEPPYEVEFEELKKEEFQKYSDKLAKTRGNTPAADGIRSAIEDDMARTLDDIKDAEKRGNKAAAQKLREKEELKVEEKMTDAELKKREEIVLSLKPVSDWEEKYPGRGAAVMYATATKLAMKD